MLKVCVIGPECTGKTDLSAYLGQYYSTFWVPEYARTYMDRLTRPYTQEDLITIAHGQKKWEEEGIKKAKQILICDTNLLVIKIWSMYVYGTCPEKIMQWHALCNYDLYLLTHIDVPWEKDPQREHPNKRSYFMKWYQKEVRRTGVPVIDVLGSREHRYKTAIEAIETFIHGEKKG